MIGSVKKNIDRYIMMHAQLAIPPITLDDKNQIIDSNIAFLKDPAPICKGKLLIIIKIFIRRDEGVFAIIYSRGKPGIVFRKKMLVDVFVCLFYCTDFCTMKLFY